MSQRRARAPLATTAPLTPQRLFATMAIGDGILFLPFFTTRDARHVRGVCRELRALVTNFVWDDRTLESRVAARLGAVALWRTCFPRAVACTLYQGDTKKTAANAVVTDGDLALLRGVRYLDMSGCVEVTDAGLAHVVVGHGLQTLKISACRKISNTTFARLSYVLFCLCGSNVRSHAMPPDFSGLIMALSRCFCVRFAAKTKHCRYWTSVTTKLVMLALPRSVVPWRTSFFPLLNELSLRQQDICFATRFFRIHKGALSRCVCV